MSQLAERIRRLELWAWGDQAPERLPALSDLTVREWQDISTAPKDRLVLLSCVGWQPAVFRKEPWPVKVGGWWDESWHVFGASWKPTHWMPLPPAPEVSP